MIKTLFNHIAETRPDVTWLKGPDSNGDYLWDLSLPNQSEISSLVDSFVPDQILGPKPSDIKLYDFILETSQDKSTPPTNVDFVTGLTSKLHRKSILVKGECTSEEYYQSYDGTTYSNLIVKESTVFTRDALGFPTYKTVTITWYKNDGTAHETTKTWNKYYSNMEKIQEGKTRRGNLVSNLQMPCIGLISIALNGTPNATPEVILEGRKFLADYAAEFTLFIEDSNKVMLDCLNDTNHPKYISSSEYTWIDEMTPYNITIRQYITNEMTI
jgi:hypothetical protein